MVYWFLKIQKHVTFSILKIQRIISYHKSQNIEWLICWTFTKIRKMLHPSENNTPVTICRNQESGIEKSFRRKTPCTHYSHTKVWSLAPGIQLGFAMHALLPHKQTYKKTLRKNYAYVLLLKHPQENCH